MPDEKKNCIICDGEYIKTCCNKRWEKSRFCSLKCWGEFKKGKPAWNRGIPHSKETKEHMKHPKKNHTNSLKNKKRPEISGKKNGMYGVHRFGTDGPNYKKPEDRLTPLTRSIRTLPEMTEWKSQVRGRDNWTCRKCGAHGIWMEAHHIKRVSVIMKEYNIITTGEARSCSELWNIDNGITYCLECHKILKQKGGLL